MVSSASIRGWVARDPAPLLIRFCVVAGILFLFREGISRIYLATMVPLVNGIFQLEGLAVAFAREQHILRLTYATLGLEFTVHDIIYQNLMVALALFAATPGRWGWRLKWMGIAVGVLWVTHVASLYLGGYVIIWDFVESLPLDDRGALAQRVSEVLPRERDWLLSRLFGVWHTWGRPTVGLGVWLIASRRYLGLPREGGEGD
ncbi:hypothetical protein ACFL6X_00790 [Candidatus Latescibacterota bacterium]